MKETLGKRLERLRKEKNFTAKQVARLIEVPESTYHDWESNRNAKNQMPFQKISLVLAVSVTELITGELPDKQELLEGVKELEEKIIELKNIISTKI